MQPVWRVKVYDQLFEFQSQATAIAYANGLGSMRKFVRHVHQLRQVIVFLPAKAILEGALKEGSLKGSPKRRNPRLTCANSKGATIQSINVAREQRHMTVLGNEPVHIQQSVVREAA